MNASFSKVFIICLSTQLKLYLDKAKYSRLFYLKFKIKMKVHSKSNHPNKFMS